MVVNEGGGWAEVATFTKAAQEDALGRTLQLQHTVGKQPPPESVGRGDLPLGPGVWDRMEH